MFLSDPHSVFIFVSGLLIGGISGLLGIGGAVILIPCLLYIPEFFGLSALPLKLITGIASVQAMASSASSSWIHYKKKSMIPGLVLVLGGAAMIGGYLGGANTNAFPDSVITLVLIIAMVTILLLYLKRSGATDNETITLSLSNVLALPKLWVCAGLALGIGFLAGIVGLGGSIFMIPMMHTLLRIPTRNTIGTGAGTVLLTTSAAVLGKFQAGAIPINEALIILVASMIGGAIGAQLNSKIPAPILKKLLIVILCVSLTKFVFEFLSASF